MTPDDSIAQLDAMCREYRLLMQAGVRLQLQILAYRRSYKKTHPYADAARIALMTEAVTGPLTLALKAIRQPKHHYERRISALAKQLPIWPWAEKIRGFGPLGLGLLIAQLGNPSAYPNPAKCWKRMGLAVGEDGKAQRRVSGPGGIAQGFSPQRRALMHVIGDNLIKQNKTPDGQDGEYRVVYLTRKAIEREKAPDLAPIVHHKRASRYMQKRLLRHLWQAWRTNR